MRTVRISKYDFYPCFTGGTVSGSLTGYKPDYNKDPLIEITTHWSKFYLHLPYWHKKRLENMNWDANPTITVRYPGLFIGPTIEILDKDDRK